jgi:PAS domain S-box-containing protein
MANKAKKPQQRDRSAVAGDAKGVAAPIAQTRLAGTIEHGGRIYQLMVEAVRDYAIFMLDPNGYVASWNPGAERIKGYSAAEIIGQHFSVFYPQEAVETGHPQHELEIAVAEGRFEEEGWRTILGQRRHHCRSRRDRRARWIRQGYTRSHREAQCRAESKGRCPPGDGFRNG